MFASKDIFLKSSGGYQISRSVRLRSSATAYFNRTPASASNRKTWTWSGWVKLGKLSTSGSDQAIFTAGYSTSPWFVMQYQGGSSAGTFQIAFTAGVSGGCFTNAVYRDPSAWYHVVLAVDTTQATDTNRVKFYINGVQQTFASTAYPSQNYDTQVNNNVSHTIGGYSGSYVDGYLTEINFIDGQALTPSSFGQTNSVTGVWQPIKYTGTYGTNGFYLNFSDNSSNTATTIGKDYSGNGNNWTPNNISVTAGTTYDSMIDVPTNYADGSTGRGNYAVFNPVDKGSAVTIADGNLGFTNGGASGTIGKGTIAVSSGKWYWEATSVSGSNIVGIVSSATAPSVTYTGSTSAGYGYSGNNGQKYNNGGGVSYGATYTNNDVIGIALDLDSGTLTFYKNNVSQGTAFTGLSGEFVPSAGNNAAGVCAMNFGQRPFTYTPPSGFVALNTQNLPTPTISNGATVMAASTYTGTGATQTIANSGNNAGSISFKPDWVWIKSRSAATNNNLFDSVRGTTNYLISNSTAAEATNANTLTAFGTTGFTLGSDASSIGVNVNAATYVAWQWQAGQGSTSSNTSGSITSTVSVNATAGFSVATFTAPVSGTCTVGHGLGVAPSFFFIKSRANAYGWTVYHSSLGNTKYLVLNSTAASATDANTWNNTSPTSSVFTLGTNFQNTSTWVAYCFAAVAGYSAFGSYTGNGSADGPFVYCGFRPRFIMWKRTDTTGDWVIQDTARGPYNQTPNYLIANTSGAEGAPPLLDINSNGFKVRINDVGTNASGGTYIFIAFAENPLKYSLAR